MMNRGVMERQMFKKGGAAGFPDLNKDGDITQADILMGRGVKLMQDGGQVALGDIPGIEKGLDILFSNTSTGAPPGSLRKRFEEENPGYLNQMVSLPANVIDQMGMTPAQQEMPAQQPASMDTSSAPLSITELANLGLINLNNQQAPVRMQMGGDPMMAAMAQPAPVDQGVASMMPQEATPAAPGPDMAGMGVGEVDQGTVEQMLAEVAPEVGDPEQAEDFETMMNSVRGDEATVEERRAELATLVGQEDAMQTPESVLALVQPVVQLSMVDQGIGGLAEQEMQQPVEGDMAGGIMSMMGG